MTPLPKNLATKKHTGGIRMKEYLEERTGKKEPNADAMSTTKTAEILAPMYWPLNSLSATQVSSSLMKSSAKWPGDNATESFDILDLVP